MSESTAIAIVLVLIVAVTVDYVISLFRNKRSVAAKTWEWLKRVIDILWGL